MNVPPVLMSSIICDRVIFDKLTGMASLINIIQTMNATRYPVRNSLVFFCELTDGHGKSNTRIKIVDSSADDKVIFEQKGTVEFADVQQVVTLALSMQGVAFPHPGEYRFQLLAEDILLGERRIFCREIQVPPIGTQDDAAQS
ncbi:MAG: hypothetical protein E4H40_00605 [Candidatus Brocadiia bacterium]|nr:MAG: hypothetical protein E4H40_00605 [Candidatus Brocadiia bacterium]